MSQTHFLNPTPQTVHWGHFNAAIPAVLKVASGDELVIDTFSGGMSEVAYPTLFRPEHRLIVDTVPQILGPHILTGPVHVSGAEPGDTLEIRILDIELTTDWGWNIIRPLKGCLLYTSPSPRDGLLSRMPSSA